MQPTKTNPNSGWGGRSVLISTFFIYISVPGQQFNTSYFNSILIYCLCRPSDPTYCFVTVTVPQSPCLEDKANSFLLLPTRTHGYISTSVSTRDLADRIFLLGWNVAPTNHSSQNRSKPCLQTPLANLCSTLLWIYQDQQHMSTCAQCTLPVTLRSPSFHHQ